MNLERICLPISNELTQLEAVIQASLKSPVPMVEEAAHYTLAAGGKRIRPILCLLAARMSGALGPDAVKLAATLEFIHTATLLHDDVLDHATLRRGRPSANARWGNQISVLLGDFLYCRASEMLVELGNLQILKHVTAATAATTQGEIVEVVRGSDTGVTEGDYLDVLVNKTARLMSASCRVGGILGRLPEEFESALKDYGFDLGVAFQLADDVLDYEADEAVFGKTAGTDLREGKLTLPLLVALKRCDAAEASLIKNAIISDRLEEARFQEVVSLVQKYNGIAYTLDLAKSYIAKTKESLKPFKPSIEKESLVALADYVIERNK